tara:strand:+ start:394 stop:726 length:333 start_codon:yes stop_codon:yes gene_type:complete
MKIVDALKSNIVMVPVVASVVVGTFTGIKYIVELTDTIDRNATRIERLETSLTSNKEKLNDSKQVTNKELAEVKADIAKIEASMRMGEDLYRVLADQVREHSYDIKDLNR